VPDDRGRGRTREVASAAVLLAVAIAAVLEARKLPAGTVVAPGAGFFPLLLAAGLAVVAAILLVRALLGPPPAASGAPVAAAERVRLLVVVAALFAYVVLLQPLGFVLASFLLMLALFRAVQSHRWVVAIGESVAAAILGHLVFQAWLGVRLPRGPWGF
jgi:hypothetical protein